jgi:hypothetical protein
VIERMFYILWSSCDSHQQAAPNAGHY